jgi:hypothetical protein
MEMDREDRDIDKNVDRDQKVDAGKKKKIWR